MLNVIKLNVIKLNVIKLTVIILNVIMLNVIMLSVKAPFITPLHLDVKHSIFVIDVPLTLGEPTILLWLAMYLRP